MIRSKGEKDKVSPILTINSDSKLCKHKIAEPMKQENESKCKTARIESPVRVRCAAFVCLLLNDRFGIQSN